jgi:hypothetical protein
MIEVHGEKERAGPKPGCGERSFTAGMACPYNDYIKRIHGIFRSFIVYQIFLLDASQTFDDNGRERAS